MKDGVMGEKMLKHPMPVRCQSKDREAEDAKGQAHSRISTSFA